jgi:hypothetical protein
MNRGTLPHAGELFTDRESESDAFKAALSAFRRYIDGESEAGKDSHNVLTFYGMGGIGKTAMSERLEAWVNRDLPLASGWGPPPSTKVDATIRIDLHGSAGQMDILAALLALRAGADKLKPRWPVFDLAFTAYWSAVRPGEPLPDYRGSPRLNDSVAKTAGSLLGDLGSIAADVTVPGAGAAAGLGVLGVRKLIGELRRRRDLQLAIDTSPDFEIFLMRCADEPSPTDPRHDLACELAGALSWELSRSPRCPLLTAFVDTIERLKMDPRRVSEAHLNRMIYFMPNVLFVLTGRDMLDWHEETRFDLTYKGKERWPGLVPGVQDEPRQHRVGNLSRSDTKDVIRRGRQLLQLSMSDEIVDELAKASAGLPQYLELALEVAISIKDAGGGRQLEVADVTGSLDSLVMRVLDDIPADEQRAIRAACLFRIFDIGLVAAAANVDHGCVERAVLRPMIVRHDGERFPYRMHDAVRDAIRETGYRAAGGWSERDWQLAAGRAAVAARGRHNAAKHDKDNRGVLKDTRGVLDAIGIAIGLVCDQETALEPSSSDDSSSDDDSSGDFISDDDSSSGDYADWLSSAIAYSPSIQGLRSRIPGSSKTAYGQHVLDFITAKSIETPFEERLQLLRQVFDSDHPLRILAGRHLGYALRSSAGRWDDALAVFDELIRLSPSEVNVRQREVNIRQRPITLSLARRFVEARDAAEGTKAIGLINRVAEYAHGKPERYFDEVNKIMDKHRETQHEREYLEEWGELIERRAFFHGDLQTSEIDELREVAELSGHTVATRSALLATVLHHEAEPTELSVALERLRMLDQASDAVGAIGFRYAQAEFCDAILAADHARLEDLKADLLQHQVRSRSWIPVECFLQSVGLPLPPVPTQWLEPYDAVAQRWTAHLHQYIDRHTIRRIVTP